MKSEHLKLPVKNLSHVKKGFLTGHMISMRDRVFCSFRRQCNERLFHYFFGTKREINTGFYTPYAFFFFQTADWARVFSHRMRMSHFEKEKLVTFQIEVCFSELLRRKQTHQPVTTLARNRCRISHDNFNNSG